MLKPVGYIDLAGHPSNPVLKGRPTAFSQRRYLATRVIKILKPNYGMFIGPQIGNSVHE